MSLYGLQRDIAFILHINREIINKIIDQQAGYYKIIIDESKSNIYGESINKSFNDPVLINLLVERNPQITENSDLGVDRQRIVKFYILRQDLVDIELVPEIGDILLLDNDYYEVHHIEDNNKLFGKDPDYSYHESNDQYGHNLSIILEAHYTRPEKLGLDKQRI